MNRYRSPYRWILPKSTGSDIPDDEITELVSRRRFIKKSALSAFELILGTQIFFANNFPNEMTPAFLLNGVDAFQVPGKHPELIVLNDRPLNVETPPHLLDPDKTPSDLFFIRNNGIPPARSQIRLSDWNLEIAGESIINKLSFNLSDLKNQFDVVKYDLTLECGGNGRSEFDPPASGNQWSLGAVGCAEFEGVRLRDVLKKAGIKDDAVYIGYYGADLHLSGDPAKEAISRGVPISKAMEAESLIAWNMNSAPLPIENGYPLRLVFGGWPASCSGKWLKKIVVRNKVHDGTKMDGSSYRVPCEPVAPGEMIRDDQMCIIESMPVKSLITYPKTGAILKTGISLNFRGHAWAGDDEVKEVYFSIDFGKTWQSCMIKKPVNRLAWQRFSGTTDFPGKGYYELWARAVDSHGISQPMLLPGWNPKGYLNNACHRIAIKII